MKKMFAALCMFLSLHALSQTIYFVNDNASGAGNGSSWADAFTKLQDALSAAVSGDQIWVAEGIYYPDEGGGLTNNDRTHSFHLKTGVAIYGGFAGTETLLSERNVTTNITTLSGEIQQDNTLANNTYHVVQSSSVNNTAVLDGFTIVDGFNNESSFTVGAGMYNNNSSPTLTNCSFSGNTSVFGGGGMYNNNSSPTLTNCSFSGNGTFGGSGGGMHNSSSSPILVNCSFSGNTAFSSGTGGGMYNDNSFPSLTNCSFSGNTAIFGAGGGMYNSSSSPSLVNCSFSLNTSAIGGGMYNSNSSPSLVNCSFSGNMADIEFGGGMFNSNSSPSLVNCSFSGNMAVEGGGGMYNNNSAPKLTNCILWGNTSEIVNNEDSNPVVAYSIVQGGFPGTGNLDQDPLFVDAASGDLHLQTGSPAIDVGLNSANTTSVDLDGNPRVVNGTIDMGAFEFQDEGIVVSSFTLVNADTDEDIRELKDGDVIDLSTLLNTRLNIRANTNPPVVGSVVFDLSWGGQIVHRADNTAPYAFIRYDRDNNPRNENDYHGVIPSVGDYTLTANPYSGTEGGGQKGSSKTITFKVVNHLPTTSIAIRTEDAKQIEGSKHFRVLIAPNPFSATTKLQYEQPSDGMVSIKVYDVVGREVATIVQAEYKAGVYQAGFDAHGLSKGIYYYRALFTTQQKAYTQTGKLMVIK